MDDEIIFGNYAVHCDQMNSQTNKNESTEEKLRNKLVPKIDLTNLFQK